MHTVQYMKPLSPNNNQLRITLPLFLGGFGVLLAFILLKNNWVWMLLGVSSIGGFASFYILRIYNQTKNVFYDTDFLYLKSKYKTKKIALQKVKRVKLTLSDQRILGIHYYEYRIEFVNEFDMNDSINVWMRSIHDHVSEFEKYLDYYAPNVEIDHSESTFDM